MNKIKVLSVCRKIERNMDLHNFPVAEFVLEQNEALKKLNVEYEYLLIEKGGIISYIKYIFIIRKFLKKNKNKFSLIHAHGGHIGLIVNFQRKIPVLTTYHGSDINVFRLRLVSYFSILLSKRNILVSPKMKDKLIFSFNVDVIPCGVDFELFKPLDKKQCRQELGLPLDKSIVLFGGQEQTKEKNYELAKLVSNAANVDILIELKGFTRDKVVKMLNACDCVLLTSFIEGSPMIIKEALACNRPIVSTDVGDVLFLAGNIYGVYISKFEPALLTNNLCKATLIDTICSRDNILFLDNKEISKRIYEIYSNINKPKA